MPRPIRVGMVGYRFMGRTHSNAYRQVAHFFELDAQPVMRAICGRDQSAVRAAAQKLGWESCETSWEKLVSRDDIDLVDITTGNDTHAQIAIAAAGAGKHIICEKPLAMDLAQAKAMLEAAERAGVKHMVCQNYRAAPAIALAKQMIEEGRLGQIYHWRGTYLQGWLVDPEFPLVWRLQKQYAGSGAHGDLNAHLVDLARWLVGEITQVCGMTETFIKQRPVLAAADAGLGATAGREMGEVTVDDAALFLARFDRGAVGSFESTRLAAGRKNCNRFEINGSKGSLAFNLERMNELEFYCREDPAQAQGFRTIMVTEPDHPYLKAWWPPGHLIGYEHTFVNTVCNLLQAIAQDRMPSPSFADGVKTQAVLDAALRSAESGRWENVDG